jgi:hypothetical protein
LERVGERLKINFKNQFQKSKPISKIKSFINLNQKTMKNFIIYITILVCLSATKLVAQEVFCAKAEAIANKIEYITKDEKAALKKEVEAVNVQLDNKTITQEQADSKKKTLAEATAIAIETKVGVLQEELKQLVQDKVDGKIIEQDSTRRITISFPNKKWRQKRDSIPGERRTTTQFVLAMGLNNVATNGNINKSDFRYYGSHFYEWGFTSNTRLSKTSNLAHFKYGFSVMYNNLRPTDNRFFEVNGNQTNLVTNPVNQDDSRLKNVYLVLPLHFELDFTPVSDHKGKPYFKSHKSFRLGLGGFIGTNLKTKQYIDYDANDYKTKTMKKGDFNTSNLIYGLSTYIGYKETSLYLKYDLNPLFTDNLVRQNNVSLGIRWDFN